MVPRVSLSNISCLLWAFNRQPIEYVLVSLIKRKCCEFSQPGMSESESEAAVRVQSGDRNHTKYFNSEHLV